MNWIEKSLYLIPLGPRHSDFSVLSDLHISTESAKVLAEATDQCWQAILERDIVGFGKFLRQGFEAQVAMFPNMLNHLIEQLIQEYQYIALGWKVSGAGGGYLILVSEKPVENALKIFIRRESD